MELQIEQGCRVFAWSIGQIRSRTYPCTVDQVGPIWRIYDQPHREKARAAELTGVCADPEAFLAAAGTLDAVRWVASPIYPGPDDSAMLAAFKKAGYSRFAGEPFFMVDPQNWAEPPNSRTDIVRVQTPELAEAVRKANRGRRQIESDHLAIDDAPIRLYAALDEGQVVGYVSALVKPGDGEWVSNLFVDPKYRRRGFGRSLMNAVVSDARRLGSHCSVLAASKVGALLYESMGYQNMGTLHVFRCPNYQRKPRDLCL